MCVNLLAVEVRVGAEQVQQGEVVDVVGVAAVVEASPSPRLRRRDGFLRVVHIISIRFPCCSGTDLVHATLPCLTVKMCTV